MVFPVVNTQILKDLKNLSKGSSFEICKLYKDIEDKEFVSLLFRKTVLNEVELAKEYIDKTPNWDADRIANGYNYSENGNLPIVEISINSCKSYYKRISRIGKRIFDTKK